MAWQIIAPEGGRGNCDKFTWARRRCMYRVDSSRTGHVWDVRREIMGGEGGATAASATIGSSDTALRPSQARHSSCAGFPLQGAV